ncbi:MAG: hypothetical protein LC772_11970 [Chloroflexi bacterium]|nr:hypothetical protein [Chloroflexota bacterium]
MLSTNSKTSESDILRMIDELEAMVDRSRHVFDHALWVNTPEFFALTSDMRQHLPDDIRRATKVARDSEKIVEQARGEAERLRGEAAEDAERIVQDARRSAERIIRDAQDQAARLVADHELLKQAQQQGRTLLLDAQEEAHETRRGADEYAAEVLGGIDDVLTRAQSHVRRGLEKLGREKSE